MIEPKHYRIRPQPNHDCDLTPKVFFTTRPGGSLEWLGVRSVALAGGASFSAWSGSWHSRRPRLTDYHGQSDTHTNNNDSRLRMSCHWQIWHGLSWNIIDVDHASQHGNCCGQTPRTNSVGCRAAIQLEQHAPRLQPNRPVPN